MGMPWRMVERESYHRQSWLLLVYLSCLSLAVLGVHGQQGQPPAINILAESGCDVGPALVPNMQDCVLHQLMGSNGTVTYSFQVGPRPKHSILFTLRSVGGVADMRLATRDSMYGSQVVYYNDAITETFIRVPADEVTAGQYTLIIQGMGGETQKLLLYLRLQTPSAALRLAPGDKAALEDLLTECCPPPGPNSPPFCSQFLPGALAAKTPQDDLCNIGDFVCDEEGHLQKVDFSQAGLDCNKGFPSAFGKLPSLETLTLRFNNFNGDTLDNVAAVLAGSRALRRLMIGSTNLTGTVPCALFEEHTLKTLMMSSNKLEGTLPDCVFQDPNIEELYMSMTTLSGPLPDTFSSDSSLKVWYSINADPRTGVPAGPGFSGEIPSSISNAQALQYVELSNHQLTGGVPALPPNVIMFEVQGNKLDGGIASPLPPSLVYFDVENNTLTGPIPDFSQSPDLTLLDLSDNQLTGNLPASFGAAGESLVYLDMSKNVLYGNINEGAQWENLPTMKYLSLAENNLDGFVPASLAANKELVSLNLASNLIEGDLQNFASAVFPAPAQSRQQPGGGRKLQSADATTTIDASRLIARKLFGGREDEVTPQPMGWQYDVENVRALATHDTYSARRRLQQATAAAPNVTTPAVLPAAAAQIPAASAALPTATPAPAAAEPQVVAETPAPGGATTTTMQTPDQTAAQPDTLPQEPTGMAATVPQDQAQVEPTARSEQVLSDNPQLGPAADQMAQTQAQPVGQQYDIGLMEIPTSSAMQGNSFLYLNLSNNAITGGIPNELQNLEMFRNPFNSTDPYDTFVRERGGPDRLLDLTYNRLYGEFPLFIMEASDLQSGCSCSTTFNVTDGNFLYCPTKASLAGVKVTKEMLNAIEMNNYTCLLPQETPDRPVSLADYLSQPASWLTAIPAAADVVTEKQMTTRQATNPNAAAARSVAPSGQGGGFGGPLSPGAIAGIVIGVVGGLAIIASLAYFVGYKKFYQVHRATSFRKGDLPDGPGMGGSGPYPPAAYGAQPGTPALDIETPLPAPKP